MTAGERARVMARMPEQSVVVAGLVLRSVIDVDVDHMGGELIHHAEPTYVAASNELDEGPIDSVVLVVVMRDHWWLSSVVSRLVIGIDVAEMPPAVLVDDLPLVLEGVVAFDRRIHEAEILRVEVLPSRSEVRNRFGSAVPFRCRLGHQRSPQPRY